MHTISETGHTGDVLACVYAMDAMLATMEAKGLTAEDFRQGHARLDDVKPVKFVHAPKEDA
jgi:endoglucanase